MLDWIWEEASDQVSDACSGPFYNPPDNSTSGEESRKKTSRGRFKSFRSDESDDDDDSSDDSSRDSISAAPSATKRLRKHARKLTRRILQREPSEYDADESTFGNENSSHVASSMQSSAPSYYFQSLNDRSRSRAIFDEESTVNRHIPDDKSDVESGKTCDFSVENASGDPSQSKMEKEEFRKKNKLLWIKNHFSKNDNATFEPIEDDEEEDKPTVSPEKLEELKEVAKEQEAKRFRTFSIFAIPLLILFMAGLGLYLGLTWNTDALSNTSEEAGVTFGSEGPTLVVSPLDSDTSYVTQNEAPPLPWQDEGLEENSTGEMEETEPAVDEDLIKKHLEAYEAWKANNVFSDDDDDNYASVDVDFGFGTDETISLQRSNGND